MKGDLLLDGNATDVKSYMLEKYKLWGSWKYSKATRTKKTLTYYAFAEGANKEAIKSSYTNYFKEPWPADEAKKYELALANKQESKLKYEASESKFRMQCYLEALKRARTQLKNWDQEKGKVQEGDDFYLELRSLVNPLVSGTFEPSSLQQENFIRGVHSLTTKGKASLEEGVEANLDFMLGVHAKTLTEFKFNDGYNQFATKFLGEAKAGVWGEGKIKAEVSKLKGLELQAAIAAACGLELKVEAEAVWQRGNHGLKLAGDGRLFVGAEAEAKGTLKISGTSFEAGIKAGAFAGVKASCSGEISLQYMGGNMVSVRAEAEISFGVGAEFEASIKCSLFDGTDFTFKANLTHGVGGGVDVKANINFDRIGLSAQSQFQKVIALPTIMQGYKTTLMDQERMNQHYLTKSISALGDRITEIEEKLKSRDKLEKKHPEKVPLLQSDDF